MSAALQIFNFEGKAPVRTVVKDCDPWFVGKDACGILGLRNITEALRSLDDDERCSEILNTPGGAQAMACVSESGLYALIFKSRKPEAKRFRKWVTSEVLPSIRNSGGYVMPVAAAAPKQTTADKFSAGSYRLAKVMDAKLDALASKVDALGRIAPAPVVQPVLTLAPTPSHILARPIDFARMVGIHPSIAENLLTLGWVEYPWELKPMSTDPEPVWDLSQVMAAWASLGEDVWREYRSCPLGTHS